MAEKTASIRLNLTARGFVATVTTLEKQVATSATRMGQRMGMVGTSIRTWGRDAMALAKVMPALVAAGNTNFGSGILNGLKAIESRSLATASRVGRAFKTAFGGVMGFGGGGGATRAQAAEPKGGGPSAWGVGLATNAIGMARELASKAISKGLELTHETGKTREAAMQLSVNARQSGEYVDPGQLEKEFYGVAADVKGVTADQAAEAAAKFVTLTGDLDTARSSLRTFATVSKATGADMGAVAEATASISRQFKITDPHEIEETLGALVYQGKKGSIMMPDLAAGMQRLAAAGAAFGLGGVKGVKTLGGLTQIAKTGTGSPEQAFTAVERVIANITAHSKELAAAKVKVYEGTGANKHTRDLPDILVDTISKVGGKNIEKKNQQLQMIFGEEGIRAIKPLLSAYNEAYSNALPQNVTGGDADKVRKEAGVAALKAMFDDAINAGGSWANVVEDAGRMQMSSGAQLSASYEAMKSKVAGQVLPVYAELVTKITQNSNAVDTFVLALQKLAEMVLAAYHLAAKAGIVKEYAKPEETVEMRNKAGNFAKFHREDFVGSESAKAYGDEAGQNAEFDRRLAKQKEYDEEAKRLKEVDALQKELESTEPEKPTKGAPPPMATESQLTGGIRYTGGQAPAGSQGPVKIDGITSTVRVEIVGDRTQRAGGGGGGARSPAPGNVARP